MRSFVISEVRVFRDGMVGLPEDVVVADGRISGGEPTDVHHVVDGRGGVLIPGLMDTHGHIETPQQLRAYGRWGVTTVLAMGSPNWASMSSLRGRPGFATVRSAGAVACARRGLAVRKMGYPVSSAVDGPGDAARFVSDRVIDGVDYIKIILEENLPFRPKPLDEVTVGALIAAAHDAGFLACVHATSVRSFELASRAGADVVTHAPIARALSAEQAARFAKTGTAVSLTLVMMRRLVEHFPAPVKPKKITYANSSETVRVLREAGVRLLAGTDANSDPTAPNTIEHGAALHEELQLLVQAGLSPHEALTAATATAADVFGLNDRGHVAPGLRADLLLVNGDPTLDVRATQDIRNVWIAGEHVR